MIRVLASVGAQVNVVSGYISIYVYCIDIYIVIYNL